MTPSAYQCPVQTCKSTRTALAGPSKCYDCERDPGDAYTRKPLFDEAAVLEAATEAVMQVYKHLAIPVFRERAAAEAALFLKDHLDKAKAPK